MVGTHHTYVPYNLTVNMKIRKPNRKKKFNARNTGNTGAPQRQIIKIIKLKGMYVYQLVFVVSVTFTVPISWEER